MIGVQDTPIISYLARHAIDRGDQEYDVRISVILKRPKNEFFEP